MHDVLRNDELMRELPRIGVQPPGSCLVTNLPRVTDANVGFHAANQLFKSDLREMSKWRTG